MCVLFNRRAGEESDGDSSPRDMSSDGGDISRNLYRVSLEEEKPCFGSSSDESEDSTGDLVFEYLEAAMPFGREPLTDKASFSIFCFITIDWNMVFCLVIILKLFKSADIKPVVPVSSTQNVQEL